MTRTVHLDTLMTIASELEDDAQRVLVVLAERLRMGRKQYSDLVLATDRRDFRKEAFEEAVDMSVYLACGLLQEASQRIPTLPAPPSIPIDKVYATTPAAIRAVHDRKRCRSQHVASGARCLRSDMHDGDHDFPQEEP